MEPSLCPPEGLEWDTTQLYTKGVLRIAEPTAIGSIDAATKTRTEYFQLSGERMEHPAKGGVHIRCTTADGQVTPQKVNVQQ